ncbi:MAG: pentapeptide repeat-containing protein, partial [Algicola sp.]|nr:pentapeptide repeat-containing protein [Algicola sp.]
CNMEQADFSHADLTSATFKDCNLKDTIFEHCILEKTDFKTAYNLAIDPNKNKMNGAKFSKDNALGLLLKYQLKIA